MCGVWCWSRTTWLGIKCVAVSQLAMVFAAGSDARPCLCVAIVVVIFGSAEDISCAVEDVETARSLEGTSSNSFLVNTCKKD